MQCTKHYSKKLLTQFFREGNASALDKFIFIIAPFIQLLSFALTIELFIFKLTIVKIYFYSEFFIKLKLISIIRRKVTNNNLY